MIDPFISGILVTCGVLGLAVLIRKHLEAKSARAEEIFKLQTRLTNMEFDVASNKRGVDRVEADCEKEHKEVRGDVAVLTNRVSHLSDLIAASVRVQSRRATATEVESGK